MEIKVLFFGVLAEVTGVIMKHYREIASFDDLKKRLSDDFPELIHYTYRVAVNSQLSDSDMELNDGDEVALMPPFAGG